MGVAEILALVSGLFQFPKQLLALINVLKKSTAEKQAEITKMISDEDEKLRKTGRPIWGG